VLVRRSWLCLTTWYVSDGCVSRYAKSTKERALYYIKANVGWAESGIAIGFPFAMRTKAKRAVIVHNIIYYNILYSWIQNGNSQSRERDKSLSELYIQYTNMLHFLERTPAALRRPYRRTCSTMCTMAYSCNSNVVGTTKPVSIGRRSSRLKTDVCWY